jgi:lipid-binding SYLF domain-containing protein
MNTLKLFRLIALPAFIVALTFSTQSALAEWTADPEDKRQVKAATAIANFRERIPRTEMYFDEAYGYAILPSVTRVGFGFGGAYGKGIVIERDEIVGTTGYWQFSSGIQMGARYFSMIVFFRDREALEYFKTREMQFVGQAGLAVATVGVAGTPAYNEGVAIVTMTRLGLMGEFAAAGAKYTYKALDDK